MHVYGHDRQRVETAVQLFSDTVSKCLLKLYGDEYKKQAEIISLFDQFWDVMDSRNKYHWKRTKCGLGVHEQIQFDILEKMDLLVKNMYFVTQTGNNFNRVLL